MASNPNVAPQLFDRALLRARMDRARRVGPVTFLLDRVVEDMADRLQAVTRGIDMFDCVLPTRSGRTAQAFTRRGTVNLRNARHGEDNRPLDAECGCDACTKYGRAYLHHLVRSGETLGATLLSEINVAYYQRLMHDIRDAIAQGTFTSFFERTRDQWARGDIAPR